MKKPFTLSVLLWCAIITTINAQNIGVNEDGSLPDASAILDVKSSNKGVLVPRLSTDQRIGIAQPATGLLVFDTLTKSFWFYTGTTWKEVTGDNLGGHTASQNLQLLDNWISRDGDDEGIRINATGNVGINTSNPQQKLFLEDGNLGIKRGINSSNPSILFQNTGPKYGWRMYYKDFSNELIFAGGQENDPSLLSDLVIFKGNGNVGIGDPNPLFKLSVDGTANFSDAVTIGDYTFPVIDGMSGQILSTNGSGMVNWIDQIDTDDQTLNLTNNTLSIEGGNSVDLSAYVDTDTDDQTLDLTNNILSIDGGNSVDLSAYVDTDTDDQTLDLTNNTLSIDGGNSIDLSAYVNTDDQTLNLTNNTLSIEGGNSVDLGSYLDNTDDQTLVLTNNTLSIEGGNSIDLSAYVNTDDQTLNLTNNTLSIEGGNSIDLSAYVNTDDQTLNLTNNTLSIGGGNSVDLSAYVNTDDQTLDLTNNILTIEGGNSVDLNALSVADNLGNHTVTQNIRLSNNWISYEGDDEGIAINIEGNVGIGTNSLQQKFTVFDGNTTIKSGPNTTSPSLLFQNSGILYGWRMYYENSTKNLVFAGGQNNDISSLTDYVTFKNDGNVGIGDSDPTFKLSVNGTANFTDEVTFETANFNNIGIGTPASTSSIPFLLKKAGASGPVGITQNVVGGGHTMEFTTQDGSGNQAVRFLLRGSNDASDIEFYTGGSGSESQTVMIEGDNGYMGVGTNAPSSSLHVRNNITASANFVAEVENTANANNFSNGLLITAGQDVQTANNRFISFQRPDGMEIGAVRQISDSTVDFFTPSDRRLKTDFTKSSYGLKDLLQIEVRDYFYKGDLSNKKTGFIAQQLQPFFPDAVSEGGTDAKTDPWMVNYGRLTPLIVQAIQDQQDYIISLEEEVAHLKSELAEVQSLKAEMAEIKAMLIKQRSSVQDEE